MTFTEIKTYPLSDDADVFLTAYIAPQNDDQQFNDKRRGLLICPGGAYAFVSQREGDAIATAFLAKGFNTFVLSYTVNNRNHRGKKFPAQLIEAAKAMKLIKDNAEQFHVDPELIFVAGFSAGGHLAASLGILYNSDYVKAALDIPDGYLRPAGMILSYPVITGGEFAHRGSIDNILLDERDDESKRDEVSLEKRVDENTVPAFIWHTRTDNVVPVQNSLLLASALAEHGIGFEMHIYPYGGHGASLATDVVGWDNPTLAAWFERAVKWAKSIKPDEKE
ncbi:MAG: alpha/beta hydrolase [Clostridia bacterium]|nr:alpha/beta hydrolase [Clostridia bacterium]